MPTGPLRLLVAVVIAVLLGRAAIGAWRNRALTFAIWRGVRGRHVAGAAGMLAVVATVGGLLLSLAPLSVGLGNLLRFNGNAVFVPLEEAAIRAGPAPTTGPDWALAGLATLFLGFLLVLLPWLAFVEEELFRAGLEDADLPAEAWAALRFGLAHLIMLVPIAAALAIAVAGFVYGRIYRRAHGRTGDAWNLDAPDVVFSAYRPPKRARAALRRAFDSVRADTPASGPFAVTPLLPGVADAARASAVLVNSPDPRRRQAAAVYASTVWHATFNSLVVVLLWAAILYDALLSP